MEDDEKLEGGKAGCNVLVWMMGVQVDKLPPRSRGQICAASGPGGSFSSGRCETCILYHQLQAFWEVTISARTRRWIPIALDEDGFGGQPCSSTDAGALG